VGDSRRGLACNYHGDWTCREGSEGWGGAEQHGVRDAVKKRCSYGCE
jgi:hypothetical protein